MDDNFSDFPNDDKQKKTTFRRGNLSLLGMFNCLSFIFLSINIDFNIDFKGQRYTKIILEPKVLKIVDFKF